MRIRSSPLQLHRPVRDNAEKSTLLQAALGSKPFFCILLFIFILFFCFLIWTFLQLQEDIGSVLATGSKDGAHTHGHNG